MLFISLVGSAIGYIFIGFANTLLFVFVGRIIGGIAGGGADIHPQRGGPEATRRPDGGAARGHRR